MGIFKKSIKFILKEETKIGDSKGYPKEVSDYIASYKISLVKKLFKKPSKKRLQ